MLKLFEQDIKEQFIYIFGEEWKAGIYDLELSYQYAFEDGYDLALNVWLSKQGYISWMGFHAGGYKRPIEDNRDNERVITRATEIIEANMQAKHPDLDLKLVSATFWDTSIREIRWNFNETSWKGEKIEVPGLEPEADPLTITLGVISFFIILLWILLSNK